MVGHSGGFRHVAAFRLGVRQKIEPPYFDLIQFPQTQKIEAAGLEHRLHDLSKLGDLREPFAPAPILADPFFENVCGVLGQIFDIIAQQGLSVPFRSIGMPKMERELREACEDFLRRRRM